MDPLRDLNPVNTEYHWSDLTDMTPIYKKWRNSKANYRPIVSYYPSNR